MRSFLIFVLTLSFCVPAFAREVDPLFPVEIDGRYGFINKLGKIVIDPQFEAVGDFSEGFARFKKNEKWGFIDRRGRIVIAPRFEWAHDFSEGLARVQMLGSLFHTPRSWGFINRRGAIAIRPQF